MRSRSCRGDRLWVTGRTAVCVGAEVLTATHHFPVKRGGVSASSRGKWGKADYLRKDLDLWFTGCCFPPVITTKGKLRISALIFLCRLFTASAINWRNLTPKKKTFWDFKNRGAKRTTVGPRCPM